MPTLSGIIETALYVEDTDRASKFYEDILGLRRVPSEEDRLRAYSVADELAAWEKHLAAHSIEIESRVYWPLGGTSIYFRDPDGNLLELATPGMWSIY